MTITRAETTTSWGIGGAVWPQVDLLPPEVREGRKLKSTKRTLLFSVLGVVVVVTLAAGAAFVRAATASSELTAVQGETTVLLAEQTKYAEVPRVLGQISTAESARQAGMSTEILWKPYLEALRAVTPPGVSYDTISVTAATPVAAAPASTDALASASVGQIAFTARSTTLPDMSAWMDAISTVSGLGDPWFTSASLTDQDGAVFYQVSATVSIRDSAFAHRFVPKEGK
jgi:Tfp pilus assembly protein PilN